MREEEEERQKELHERASWFCLSHEPRQAKPPTPHTVLSLCCCVCGPVHPKPQSVLLSSASACLPLAYCPNYTVDSTVRTPAICVCLHVPIYVRRPALYRVGEQGHLSFSLSLVCKQLGSCIVEELWWRRWCCCVCRSYSVWEGRLSFHSSDNGGQYTCGCLGLRVRKEEWGVAGCFVVSECRPDYELYPNTPQPSGRHQHRAGGEGEEKSSGGGQTPTCQRQQQHRRLDDSPTQVDAAAAAADNRGAGSRSKKSH